MPTLAAVMLNWRRPENVVRIARNWVECPLLNKRIIWGNKYPLLPLPTEISTIWSNTDLGLYTRFHAGILSRCDAVFMQDDDLLIPHETITQLFERWQERPNRIHGLFGRTPRRDGTYAQSYDHYTGACDIVLTRCMIVSSELLRRFMVDVQQFLHLQAVTYGNGEDIILSHVAKRYSGHPNMIWDYPREELSDEGVSIWDREGRRKHQDHRTKVMHACQEWLRKEGIE